MQKIKVCHLTSAHSPFDDRIYHKQCKSLSKVGYNVTVISQHDKEEIDNGIKFVAIKKARNRVQRIFGISIKIFFKALKQKSDVYHFHDPELLSIGVLLKLLAKRKIIYDVHEDYSLEILSKPYLPKITRRSICFLVRMAEYLSSFFFDSIITATDDILKKFSYHEGAVSVKNYPRMSYFSKKKDRYNKTHKKSNVFNLVYVGNISEDRGVIEMIQALSYIYRPIKLSFYGNFVPKNLQLKLDNIKGFEKVEFLGWVENKKVAELLSIYDAGIVCLHPLPNYLTALPIKLFEYMAAGLPVVASNFPILKEIIEGNKCGICVDPLNSGEIARIIEYLMEQPELMKEMGENGRRAVLEKYNWEKESEKLIKVYKEVLKYVY